MRKGMLQRNGILGLAIALTLVGCDQARDLAREVVKLIPQEVLEKRSPSPTTTVQSPTAAEMEAAVLQRINAIRQQQDLKPLKNNERLAQVARNYSQQMARDDFFSHTGSDGSTPAKRVRAGGINYSVVGENLFKSTNAPQPVPLAVKGWMESPGHRENILRPVFTETGIGVWRDGNTYYITQLFLRPFSLLSF
jgi:uncharacterized protein YkwD